MEPPGRLASTSDLVVVGGGLVGTALAYGAARNGIRVTVLDKGDDAFRASRGNFGLVWVQGKGFDMTPYARWSMKSAAQWPQLASALAEDFGVDVQLRQPGGFYLCFSDDELQAANSGCAACVTRSMATTPSRCSTTPHSGRTCHASVPKWQAAATRQWMATSIR